MALGQAAPPTQRGMPATRVAPMRHLMRQCGAPDLIPRPDTLTEWPGVILRTHLAVGLALGLVTFDLQWHTFTLILLRS